MYVFLGWSRIDFENDRGEKIRGYKLHMAEKGTGDLDGGYRPFSAWFSDVAWADFVSAYGGSGGLAAHVRKACDASFDRRGRVVSLTFEKK